MNICVMKHAYNRAKNSCTHGSPFETCFGFIPRSPLDFVFAKFIVVDGHSDMDKATKFIKQIQEIHHEL